MLQDTLRKASIPVPLIVVAGALAGAALLGHSPSSMLLALLLGAVGALLLMSQAEAGFVVVIVAAYMVPFEIGLGHAFTLSAVHILIPGLALLWVVRRALGADSRLIKSRTFLPLLAFLLAATFSWLYGNVTWDLRFPRRTDVVVIQAAQWTVYGLSILAYLLASQQSGRSVHRSTFAFLGLGVLALIHRYGGPFSAIGSVLTTGDAQTNGTFFVWMTALAGGQALFNDDLRRPYRAALLLLALSVPLLGFWQNTDWVSSWGPPLVVLGILLVLRSPAAGGAFLVLAIVALLVLQGPGSFAWQPDRVVSIEGRLVLWESVIQMGLRQPLFGLGPTNYNHYHRYIPLLMEGGGQWFAPIVNSHNLYVDLFAQVGLIGLALFLWAMTEIGLLALRLRRRVITAFDRAYVNSALAGLAAMLVASGVVEWLLPFVYNVGLRGVRFGVFSWIFLGYLVVIARDSQNPRAQRGV